MQSQRLFHLRLIGGVIQSHRFPLGHVSLIRHPADDLAPEAQAHALVEQVHGLVFGLEPGVPVALGLRVEGVFRIVPETKGSGNDEKCEKANTCFVPSEVKVTKGGTVTWVNKDSSSHTILSGNIKTGPDNKFGTTDVLPKDGSFSQKFDTAGTYEYFDIVHPWMKGKVIVS